MIVFEPELWGVSPLTPAGKSPTKLAFGTPSAAGTAAPAKKSDGLKLWDGGSFDFNDVLDVINPLQHLPVISSIYRAEVGDEIGAVPRLLGSMLYGGGLVGALIGAASAIFNIVVEHETGKDLGQHIYTALFGERGGSRRTTQVAAPKTGISKTGISATAPSNTGSSQPAAAVAPNTNPIAGTAKAAPKANAAPGGAAVPNARALTPKAHAALQAFVAGLAKNASPAAAAAATRSTVAQSAVRVAGAAAKTAPATGAGAKGEVSTQFRRARWYQRNQAILRAQAAELAEHQAAAKAAKAARANAAKTNPAGATAATGMSAILQLFTTPGAPAGKPAKAGAPAASAPPAKTATPTGTRTTNTGRGAVAGPWVVNEIGNGLAKYETLVKARKAAGAAAGN
jgi:hypothetical protein